MHSRFSLNGTEGTRKNMFCLTGVLFTERPTMVQDSSIKLVKLEAVVPFKWNFRLQRVNCTYQALKTLQCKAITHFLTATKLFCQCLVPQRKTQTVRGKLTQYLFFLFHSVASSLNNIWAGCAAAQSILLGAGLGYYGFCRKPCFPPASFCILITANITDLAGLASGLVNELLLPI